MLLQTSMLFVGRRGMHTSAPVPNNREDGGSHFQWEFALMFWKCFDPKQANLEGKRGKWSGGILPVWANKQNHYYNRAGSLLRLNAK